MTAIALIDLACCNAFVKFHDWPVRRHEVKGRNQSGQKRKRCSIV